ncbi:MAG: hypothetical protein C0482_00960 [Gordonia sp.]|nr:hypothetical protein [Gordonia sp. (in: high G+C Gram-positive bacteria)]
MQITRLRAKNFRGWVDLDIQQTGHVVALGEPRAGRTDIVAALARVLDPRSTRLIPSITDIHQSFVITGSGQGLGKEERAAEGKAGEHGAESVIEPEDVDCDNEGVVVRASFAEVEATLVDLGPDVEQEALGALEPLTEDRQVDESGDANPSAALGLRIAYRLSYDSATESLEHVVYYPATSNPSAGQIARVPAAVRNLLPVIFLDASQPMQLRAEGLLRRLLDLRDPDAVTAALRALEADVSKAAGDLSATPVVSQFLDAILSPAGPARRAGDRPLTASDVQFLPGDGTLSGILRAVQPVISLDQAGPLALNKHGSTTTAVLAAAEATILAASTQGSVVVGDDFGEGLDGGSAEHLATAIKNQASQIWLTTRRAEVARAFKVSELVRFTRRGGSRLSNRVVTPTDKKEVAAQRHIHSQLLPALTATTVVVVEGRHDLTTLTAADSQAGPTRLPLAAHGVRLISADNGDSGGGSQIPRIATLAKSLGFRVLALIDSDPVKKSATVVADIQDTCDAVVRLPERMAIERAILAGSNPTHLRAAAAVLTEFGQQDPTIGRGDDQLEHALVRSLHKNGLHEPFLAALIDSTKTVPIVLTDALKAIACAGALDYAGPQLIDLTFVLKTDLG